MPLATDPAATLAAITTPVAAAVPAPAPDPVIVVTQPAPVVTAPPTLPAEERFSIPKSLYERFTSNEVELARVKAEKDAEVARIKIAEATAIAKAGDAERAVELLRSQAAAELEVERTQKRDTESRAKRYALDAELANALNSHQLADGSAEQLKSLFRGAFVAEPEGDTFKVRTPDFQSVGAYIGAMLGRPEYQKFLAAKNPGGGVGPNPGAAQTTPTPAAVVAEPVKQPSNLGEALVMDALSRSTAATQVDPRMSGGYTFQNGRPVRSEGAAIGLRPTVPFGAHKTA